MAQSNTYTTGTSTLVKNYKKVATKAYEAFKTSTEEFDWIDDIPTEDVEISLREILIPLDIAPAYGTAMIPEAGYEAVTATPAMDEGSVSVVQMNQRFIISLLSQQADQKARAAQVFRQVKYQTMKAAEAMARRVGQQTYGYSTGVVAQVSAGAGAATSHTITIKNAWGDSNQNNAAQLASLFKIGEGVALIQSSALVTNAIGTVTAVSASTPSITVTWGGSVTTTTNDNIVFANAVTDATITATDFGRWPVGFLDACKSSSVHSLATSSQAEWAAGYADTTGGRLSYVRINKLRQGLLNTGSRKLNKLIWSNGVLNDVTAGERAALRYNSSTDLDLDGSISIKGVKTYTSVLVPTGSVFGWDSDVYSKLLLTDKPDTDGVIPWAEMDKSEDRNALKASINFTYARMVRSRRGMGYFQSLTEQ